MNRATWFRLLELAEEYDWNPLGTAQPEQWQAGEVHPLGYDPDQWPVNDGDDPKRLVLLEDALNLADALERAFLVYEPDPAPQLPEMPPSGQQVQEERARPSIGAILALMEFCQQGAFWIEKSTKT
jgi:hypothetical protein